jgi:hypothetical protein
MNYIISVPVTVSKLVQKFCIVHDPSSYSNFELHTYKISLTGRFMVHIPSDESGLIIEECKYILMVRRQRL